MEIQIFWLQIKVQHHCLWFASIVYIENIIANQVKDSFIQILQE
jgi:hypothetical protein